MSPRHPDNTLNELSGEEWLYFTKSVITTAFPSSFLRVRPKIGSSERIVWPPASIPPASRTFDDAPSRMRVVAVVPGAPDDYAHVTVDAAPPSSVADRR